MAGPATGFVHAGGSQRISNATPVTAGENDTCALLSDRPHQLLGRQRGRQAGMVRPAARTRRWQCSGSACHPGRSRLFHVCAPLSTGDIDCWGNNENGDSGNGDSLAPCADRSAVGSSGGFDRGRLNLSDLESL